MCRACQSFLINSNSFLTHIIIFYVEYSNQVPVFHLSLDDQVIMLFPNYDQDLSQNVLIMICLNCSYVILVKYFEIPNNYPFVYPSTHTILVPLNVPTMADLWYLKQCSFYRSKWSPNSASKSCPRPTCHYSIVHYQNCCKINHYITFFKYFLSIFKILISTRVLVNEQSTWFQYWYCLSPYFN